jgi:hypothetical protein
MAASSCTRVRPSPGRPCRAPHVTLSLSLFLTLTLTLSLFSLSLSLSRSLSLALALSLYLLKRVLRTRLCAHTRPRLSPPPRARAELDLARFYDFLHQLELAKARLEVA